MKRRQRGNRALADGRGGLQVRYEYSTDIGRHKSRTSTHRKAVLSHRICVKNDILVDKRLELKMSAVMDINNFTVKQLQELRWQTSRTSLSRYV